MRMASADARKQTELHAHFRLHREGQKQRRAHRDIAAIL